MLRTRDVDQINQITLIHNTLRKRIQRECKQIRKNCDEIIPQHLGQVLRDNNKTRKRTRHEHFPKERYKKPIEKQESRRFKCPKV